VFTKNIQTSAAVLISCIFVYGIAFAQQVCCREIVNAGIPAPTIIACDYISNDSPTIFPSHYRNTQLRPKLCRNILSLDFGSGNTCCETDRCNDYSKVTYLSLSFVQDSYPVNKYANTFVAGIDSQTSFAPYRLPAFFKASPIYIIKQSIIC
jgi:hypothetical protein